ncbi:hypothetical protein A961_1546 [Enterococcus faecalis ATCC 29212]|nr:Hypothetical protein DENG_00651 [Enterococcus faecalis DENG1]EJS79664.1 hypothetical protein A961_1546 [Enterococcus faecalis ATCC 29212]ERL13226.1 hypothetical protein HMPREF1160_2473 [Enterococcus faecalis E12]OSH09694.1 hypothetical protein ELS84_1635 [Enterococcus faecalis]SJN37246.1 hypothetical protein FM120_10590 [Sphingobacterium faecium PCAi_F2.5]
MFLQRMVGQNNGRKNFFAHFIKNFFYSNPLFSPTTRCEPKARRRTLSYTKMTYQKQKK